MKTSLRVAQYDSGLTAVARLMYESCWSVLRGVEIDLRVLRVIANREICIVGGTMSQTIANILVGEVCQPSPDVISAATLFVEQQSFPDRPRREPFSSGRGQYRAGR